MAAAAKAAVASLEVVVVAAVTAVGGSEALAARADVVAAWEVTWGKGEPMEGGPE